MIFWWRSFTAISYFGCFIFEPKGDKFYFCILIGIFSLNSFESYFIIEFSYFLNLMIESFFLAIESLSKYCCIPYWPNLLNCELPCYPLYSRISGLYENYYLFSFYSSSSCLFLFNFYYFCSSHILFRVATSKAHPDIWCNDFFYMHDLSVILVLLLLFLSFLGFNPFF